MHLRSRLPGRALVLDQAAAPREEVLHEMDRVRPMGRPGLAHPALEHGRDTRAGLNGRPEAAGLGLLRPETLHQDPLQIALQENDSCFFLSKNP